MGHKRTYRTFTHKEAVFRICFKSYDTVTAEIIRQRKILELYIDRHPEFGRSFVPIEVHDDAPQVARQMAQAARLVGVGPMASVAGAMAQCACQVALDASDTEAIVENGGDIYLKAAEPVLIALGTGTVKVANNLAFSLNPNDTPVSICSSSGRMGHSKSFGKCDLATVVAKDAALADAAATQSANMVKSIEDVDHALERIKNIEGVEGVIIVKDERIGLAGKLPSLVRIQ
jgi:ApbE superfamily uncharacterized protein (UPF0280 family)